MLGFPGFGCKCRSNGRLLQNNGFTSLRARYSCKKISAQIEAAKLIKILNVRWSWPSFIFLQNGTTKVARQLKERNVMRLSPFHYSKGTINSEHSGCNSLHLSLFSITFLQNNIKAQKSALKQIRHLMFIPIFVQGAIKTLLPVAGSTHK
jgi:hypothetical protein